MVIHTASKMSSFSKKKDNKVLSSSSRTILYHCLLCSPLNLQFLNVRLMSVALSDTILSLTNETHKVGATHKVTE